MKETNIKSYEKQLIDAYGQDALLVLIKYKRIQKGFSISEVSKEGGWATSNYSKIENGKLNISPKFLQKILSVLDINNKTIEDFFNNFHTTLEYCIFKDYKEDPEMIRQLAHYFREENNLSEIELSKLIKVDYKTINSFETQYSMPKLETIVCIFYKLKVTYEDYNNIKRLIENRKIPLYIPTNRKQTECSQLIEYIKKKNNIDSITISERCNIPLVDLLKIEYGMNKTPSVTDMESIYKVFGIDSSKGNEMLKIISTLRIQYNNQTDELKNFFTEKLHDIPDFMKYIRLNKGLTLVEFSELLGIDANSYKRMESKVCDITYFHFKRFTTNLGIKIEEINNYFKNPEGYIEYLVDRDYTNDFEVLRQMIYYIRKQSDLDRKDFAKKIGMSELIIENIEDYYTNSTLVINVNLIKALNLPCKDYKELRAKIKNGEIPKHNKPKYKPTQYSLAIKHKMEKESINEEDLSKLSTVPVSILLKILNGRTIQPGRSTLNKIYKILELNEDIVNDMWNKTQINML